MNTVVLALIGSGLLSGTAVAAYFKYLIDRKITAVQTRVSEATLAEQIGESASSWIQRQDLKVQALEKELADSRREVQQLRVELGQLSQELNAFRLGIAAPLGYVIIPRLIWEQARQRDRDRGELPAVSFPGEDVNTIVDEIKDPGEGGGV